jgi:hypothetical protein
VKVARAAVERITAGYANTQSLSAIAVTEMIGKTETVEAPVKAEPAVAQNTVARAIVAMAGRLAHACELVVVGDRRSIREDADPQCQGKHVQCESGLAPYQRNHERIPGKLLRPLRCLGAFATLGPTGLGLGMDHGSLNSIYHRADFEEAERPMIRS